MTIRTVLRHWSSRFLIIGVLLLAAATSPGQTPAADTPPDAKSLEGYRRVEEALTNASKNPGAVVSKSDLQGWLTTKDWLTHQKQGFAARWVPPEKNPDTNPNGLIYAGDVAEFLSQNYTPTARPKPSVVTTDAGPNTPLPPPTPSPWQVHVRLRQSYTDVLSIEDPSQVPDGSSPKKVDDLKGATINYTRDFNNNRDIWATQAALLVPIIYAPNPGSESVTRWELASAGFVPSVSLNRVTGVTKTTTPAANGNKDTDQLAARLGIYSKWNVPGDVVDTLTVRGFFTESTDTGLRSNIPAGQLEVEPQASFTKYLQIGYLTNLWNKIPEYKPGATDWSDNSYLAYQFRLRLHFDGGEILDAGKGIEPERAFAQLGPIVELRLSPFFVPHLSLTLSDEYLASFIGPDNRNNLLTVSAEYKFYDNKVTRQSVGLKAIYTRGAAEFTKQRQNALQVGLSGTF